MNDILRLSLSSIALCGLLALSITLGKPSESSFRERISWVAFCDAHGYDPQIKDPVIYNEYLDTWCGSADEEEILLLNGIKP